MWLLGAPPLREVTLEVDIPGPKCYRWRRSIHRSQGMSVWTFLASGGAKAPPL